MAEPKRFKGEQLWLETNRNPPLKKKTEGSEVRGYKRSPQIQNLTETTRDHI